VWGYTQKPLKKKGQWAMSSSPVNDWPMEPTHLSNTDLFLIIRNLKGGIISQPFFVQGRFPRIPG
jgi:hypothetical protein